MRVLIGGRSQKTLFVSEPDANGLRQVNIELRKWIAPGQHAFVAACGDARSEPVLATVR